MSAAPAFTSNFELTGPELAAAGETLAGLLACDAPPFDDLDESAREWLRGLILHSIRTDGRPN